MPLALSRLCTKLLSLALEHNGEEGLGDEEEEEYTLRSAPPDDEVKCRPPCDRLVEVAADDGTQAGAREGRECVDGCGKVGGSRPEDVRDAGDQLAWRRCLSSRSTSHREKAGTAETSEEAEDEDDGHALRSGDGYVEDGE
jgi:hypothetical protein